MTEDVDITDEFFRLLDAIMLAAASAAQGQSAAYQKQVNAQARKAVRRLAVDCGVRTDDGSFRDALAQRLGK